MNFRTTSILSASLLAIVVLLTYGCTNRGGAGGSGGGGANSSGDDGSRRAVGQAMGDLLNRATGGRVGSREVGTAAAAVKATRALSLSDRDEIEMGRSVAVALTHQYPLDSDEALQRYVTKVGLTVAAAGDRPELPYVFGVLATDEAGAYSGPGGYIFITRGLLAQMRDESELAGVLAHEVAHVARRHGLEAVRQGGLLDAASDAARAQGLSSPYAPAELTDAFVDVLLKKGYSRAQETDADEHAVRYLKSAGYDPRGYARLLSRFAGERGGGSASVLSTHPGLRDRAARVTQLAGAGGGATFAQRFAAATGNAGA